MQRTLVRAYDKATPADEVKAVVATEVETVLARSPSRCGRCAQKPVVISWSAATVPATTTIGQGSPQSSQPKAQRMLADGETSSAAIEQLKIWASDPNHPVIAGGTGRIGEPRLQRTHGGKGREARRAADRRPAGCRTQASDERAEKRSFVSFKTVDAAAPMLASMKDGVSMIEKCPVGKN